MICNIFYLLQPSHQLNVAEIHKNYYIEDIEDKKIIISCLTIYWLFIISARETLHSTFPR